MKCGQRMWSHGDEYFTAAELAARWKLDLSTIRRKFRSRPGVLKFESHGRIQIRVPAQLVSDLERTLAT
jgi:hypothetical protein